MEPAHKQGLDCDYRDVRSARSPREPAAKSQRLLLQRPLLVRIAFRSSLRRQRAVYQLGRPLPALPRGRRGRALRWWVGRNMPPTRTWSCRRDFHCKSAVRACSYSPRNMGSQPLGPEVGAALVLGRPKGVSPASSYTGNTA